MSRWLLLAALWLLALPTWAQEDFARYDLKLARLMLEQTRGLLAAGTDLEKWNVRTGGNQQTLKALTVQAERAQKVHELIRRTPAPGSAAALQQAALKTSAARVKLIATARDYVGRGNPTPAAQSEFLASSLKATGELQAQWLRDRLQVTREIPAHQPAVREWYRWQSQLLPLTLVQVKVGSQIQQLVLLEQAGRTSPLQLKDNAAAAASTAEQLLEKARQLRPAGWLKGAQQAALAEQKALTELCLAFKLISQEKSEDSVAILNHASEELRQRSLQAEEASLKCLQQALQP